MSKYYKFIGEKKSNSTTRWVGIDTRHPYHHLRSKLGVSDYLNKFKENIPLLASLILILGGGTQLIILFNLDPSLIRFFSGSQMLVDGLILLTAILSFYLVGRIVYYVEANYHLVHYIGVMFFFASIMFNRPLGGEIFVSFPFYWGIITMIYFAILLTRHNMRFPIYGTGKTTKKTMRVTNVFLYLTGIIFFWGIGYFWFNKIYDIYNVEEISNYSNVKCYLRNEPYKIDDFKVLYYNDSYVFIDILKKNKSDVKVFPISILLDSSPCKLKTDYFDFELFSNKFNNVAKVHNIGYRK